MRLWHVGGIGGKVSHLLTATVRHYVEVVGIGHDEIAADADH